MRFSPAALPIAVILGLLVISSETPAAVDKSPMTAIELLSTFSGASANRYEPFFEYSTGSRIVGIEIHAFGNESTTAKYSGREDAWREVNNILRITTADGFQGVSGVDSYYQGPYSDEHLQALPSIAADLVALRSLDPVAAGNKLEQSHPDLDDAVRASIDIALWDLAARKAGVPLHAMLGAKRDSIEAYASLPFYESLPEYVDAVNDYAKLGFTTFKYHVWGEIEKDLELVRLTQAMFAGTPYRFMIDLESVYDFDDALTLGRQMDEGQFTLLEGPIDDASHAQYADLRARLGVQIIPAGYTYYSPDYIRQAIEAGSWDAGRFDATVVGGISTALELLIIADEAGLPIEIQSWGHSLAQAVNLHLMLANERTPHFEAPMPRGPFEFGTTNGDLLEDGRVTAPHGPGLGIEVDWDRLATADFHVVTALDFSGTPE